MQLRYSGENYLKAIFLLHQEQSKVREVDIARRLQFTMASVSRMIKKLTKQGHVIVKDGDVCLTRQGLAAARRVYGRFSVIQGFLVGFLKIDPDTAKQDAGAMEHVVSRETFEAMQSFMEKKGAGC